MNIIQHIILMRPNHWIKNIFVFAPTFFSGKITNLDILNSTILSAVCFSLVSSSVYILNDIIDRQSDSLHPRKKFRPIANGSVSPISAQLAI
jgi:4-hydroxybenzoate polyprenyltransferase and related prenyltransferases